MPRDTEAPQDLLDYVKKLEARIAALERSPRIGQTSLDSGSMVINNGAVVVKHPNGTELFRTGTGTGDIPFGESGVPGYVTRIGRSNGVDIFEVFTPESGGEGRFQLFDRQGHEVVGDDYVTGKGLSRPYLPLRVIPKANLTTPPILTTSATFESLHVISGNMQNSGIQVRLQVVADPGTAGEVRLWEGFFGIEMGLQTISAGFSGLLTLVDGQAMPGLFGFDQFFNLDIQARRTAGAGNIRVEVQSAYGTNVTSI